jgi:predicted aspartyl protease
MAAPGPQVVSDHFPYLPIRLVVSDRTIETEALLDTGFDGAVVLPADMLDPEIVGDSHALWQLADGSHILAPLYRGTVSIGHLESLRVVITALGDEPLVGRLVSDHFRITLDHGIRIMVEQ